MKTMIWIFAGLCVQAVYSQQADIRRTVDTFFEGLHARDTTKIKAVTAKELVMHSINEKPAGSSLTVQTREAFLRSVMVIPLSVKRKTFVLEFPDRWEPCAGVDTL